MTHVRSTFLHFIPSRQRPFLYNKSLLNNACGNDCFTASMLSSQPLEISSLIPFFITDKTCMCDDTKTNKQANKNRALDSFFCLLSIPGMLMKMKTRQPSLFLIKTIVNHRLSFLLIFLNFQSFFPVA